MTFLYIHTLLIIILAYLLGLRLSFSSTGIHFTDRTSYNVT